MFRKSLPLYRVTATQEQMQERMIGLNNQPIEPSFMMENVSSLMRKNVGKLSKGVLLYLFGTFFITYMATVGSLVLGNTKSDIEKSFRETKTSIDLMLSPITYSPSGVLARKLAYWQQERGLLK